LIAVSFPVDLGPAANVTEIDFGAVLRRDKAIAHQFHRRVTLRLKDPGRSGERRFMFLEPADLEPGEYELTVVMAGADPASRPDATRSGVEVPPIPKKEMMLVEPILGRPRDRNVVIRGSGPETGRKRLDPDYLSDFDIVTAKGIFEPMLVQLVDEDQVQARNKACLVGAREQPGDTSITREIAEDDGAEYELPSVALSLAPQGKQKRRVLCQNLYEVLPDEAIAPGEDYELQATVEESEQIREVEEALPFAVNEDDE